MATTPASRKVLGDVNANTPLSGKKRGQEFEKLTQLEHVLIRPDTYIGATEKITDTMVVFDQDKGFNTREVTYVPGLFKIFDEIMVNAADNRQRDASMNTIKVNIDRDSGTISIYNNGRGIPIEMHSKEKIYVPELIFGHLLTSSNYNDKKKKTTGGRNGYGAKLANIFSTSFIVETADSKSGKRYRQEFTDNMSKGHGKYKIYENKKGEDWTKITFTPDLEKFSQMTELEDDIVALMTRRVYDIAGVTRDVRVYLNDKKIPIKTFKDYVGMVLQNREGSFPVVHSVVNDRWEVCMTVSNNGFQQVSFVNSIATTKGGTHVNYVTDQIVKELGPTIKRKNKGAPVKNHQIKAHLWVFVNCLIENPTFDSQTKENHTLAASKFGSKCELDKKFMKEVTKTGIIDNILVWAQVKGQEMMSKKSGGAKRTRLTGIAKLDDANEAGGRNSRKCTLILTEGDSAKTLALSGLSIIGRDFYGVFPLKGKPLNVRDASQKQVLDNAEMKSIVEIMGLKYGFQYDDSSLSKLRYGSIMIMADQDQDGSHIKGLIINMIHHFWPSLLKTEGFLVEFITPIVKVSKGKTEKQFYTLPEYESWSEQHSAEKGWKIKYYKGLGTSTPQEAKSYFAQMDKHQLSFVYGGPDDDTAIEMAFSKKKIEERKAWLRGFQKGTFLDHSVKEIDYSSFVHQELILFSMADNVRSIPSMVDGFKPGQRKIMYSCFKRKLTQEIKVAQLAGYVAEHSAYHHGEASLTSTIVGMAQTFVGSNNIALLEPCGQFGTRIQGGKDSASPRYIFTRLSQIARSVFHVHDDPLLDFLEDDGQSIEPEWYVPILPMVLVNGSDGIGTGWSSKVPSYDPRQLCEYIQAKLADEECPTLVPYFNGFTGEVFKDISKKDRYIVRGVITKLDDNTLEITELPVRDWTQDYKVFLEGLLTGEEKAGPFESKSKKVAAKEPSIKDYKEYHTDTTVHFHVTLTDAQMAAAEAIGLVKRFKMESSVALSNMVLFDQHGRLKKYSTVEEIVEDFYDVRLAYYQKRKDNLTDKLTEEWTRLDNKVRFILEIIDGKLELRNRPKRDLLEDLSAKGFTEFPKKKSEAPDDEEEDDTEGPKSNDGYDYLLSMPFWSLTLEKVNKLKSERDAKESELNDLLAKSTKDLWNDDLDVVLENLQAVEDQASANFESNRKMRAAAGRKKPSKKKRGDDSDEDDWKPTKAKKAAPKAKSAPKPLARAREETSVPKSPSATSPPSKVAKKVAKKNAPSFMLSDESEEEAADLSVKLAQETKPAKSKKAATTKKTTKPKKKSKYISDDEDDDFLVSDDDLAATTAAPVARTARRGAATKVKYDFDEDSEDDEVDLLDESDNSEDDEEFMEPKKQIKSTKATTKPTAKKAVAKKPAVKAPKAKEQPASILSDDSDDEATVGLAARLAAASKKSPEETVYNLSDSDTDEKQPAKKTVKKSAPKKAAAKKPAAKKAPAKKAPAKSKKTKAVDDDFCMSDDDVEITAPSAATAVRPSRRAAASKVSYNFADSDESDEEVDLLDDSGSDFDDFE